jgi:hypothetical protein
VKAPVEYLYAVKINELASQLRGDGYEVTVAPKGPDEGYDLVARKDNKRVAFEVITIDDLRASEAKMRQLRKRAQEQGYDDFRLVVVSPPREVITDVEGLEETLCDYFREHVPAELDSLSSRTVVDRVTDLEIDVLEVAVAGVHVAGTGVVEVSLEWGGGNERDGFEAGDTFPLSFDLTLDHQLEIQNVRALHIDTSSFSEED